MYKLMYNISQYLCYLQMLTQVLKKGNYEGTE